MYLSLAAVVSAVVLGAFLLWRKLGAMLPSSPLRASAGTEAWGSEQRPGHASADGSMAPGSIQWAAPWFALAIVAGALGVRTVLRNMDYRSAVAIWQDAVDHAPSNCSIPMPTALPLIARLRYFSSPPS